MNSIISSFLISIFSLFILSACIGEEKGKVSPMKRIESAVHIAPDSSLIPEGIEGEMIRYGKQLILNSAKYIGPDGVKGKYLGNKMNCTNCHLDAGTRPYGLNFFSTYSNYPQYRSRENEVLSIEQRVNNCVERPHSGKPLPLGSKEMIAIVSYIKWLGTGVPIGQEVRGSSGITMKYPDRVTNPKKGKTIYVEKCAICHQLNGEGKWLSDKSTYEYPPLWGPNSYQTGSSMFRVIKAAQFIKANMPFGATWDNPQLTDEEAFDVAAYINSEEHIRPSKGGADYNDIRTKYIDYPYGPYDDPFSEEQHKLGPFQPIIDYRKENGLYLK